MTRRENMLKAARFERPDYIPMTFSVNAACWHHYDQNALQDLMEAHPLLFPNFVRRENVTPHYGLNQRKDEPYTDPWGCVWTTCDDGITGSVHGHPLPEWDNLASYTPPDPETARVNTIVMLRRMIYRVVTHILPESDTTRQFSGTMCWTETSQC